MRVSSLALFVTGLAALALTSEGRKCRPRALVSTTPANLSGDNTNVPAVNDNSAISGSNGSTFSFPSSGRSLYGVSFNGKRADGACPSLQEIKDDLNFLGTNVSKNFRIYSLLECNQGELILQALRGTDYKVILGMWVGKDDGAVKAELAELSRLITTYPSEIKQSASAVLIGSESLYRKDVTEPQLIAYIKDCRNVLSTHQLDGVIPVTTAETYDWVLPDVAAAVDYVTMNAFPFWEGKTIDEAKQVFFEHYEQVKGIAKDKRVVIGETGWPTAGKPYENVAIPSLENNKRYIQEFVCEAHKRQIDYYWFASFDEPWKHNENGVDVEANWGLTYEDRRKFKIDGDFYKC